LLWPRKPLTLFWESETKLTCKIEVVARGWVLIDQVH
jgi:hypothetical protein